MKSYTIRQLSDMGLISKRLKQVLVLLDCSTFDDMIALSEDKIKVDYIEKSHNLKDELFKAISDIDDLKEIIPEFATSINPHTKSHKVKPNSPKSKKFKVGDFTEELLSKSDKPISQHDLLKLIKEYLPETYVESIRANLNGDPQKRFVFFLDGYIGLRGKEYDKRYQTYSVENKKIQHAEQRIMEFLSFIEEKHRSPQPHGLDEEETLYRWYLDFMKSTSKELAPVRATFQDYLKDYDDWVFTPAEYAYKRNCDQVKWYVDNNLELPTQEDEPELFSWFNSQLENHTKHKDKRKKMFIELMAFLSDYGMHFYNSKSDKGKTLINNKIKKEDDITSDELALAKYTSLFKSFKSRKNGREYAVQKALLIITIGNLIQKKKLSTNEVTLNDDLLTEFADVCIDIVGTASSYNIAIPYYYMNDETFWSLVPKEWVACEDSEEEEVTFDYIERTIACSIMDNDLFCLLSNEKHFKALKCALMNNVIKNVSADVGNNQKQETTDIVCISTNKSSQKPMLQDSQSDYSIGSQNTKISTTQNTQLEVRRQAILRAMSFYRVPADIKDVVRTISRTAWRSKIEEKDVKEIISTISEIEFVDGKYILREKNAILNKEETASSKSPKKDVLRIHSKKRKASVGNHKQQTESTKSPKKDILRNPVKKSKACIGDWLLWEPTGVVGKVVGFKCSGTLQKIVIKLKDGSEMDVYDNSKMYDIITS